MKKLYTFLFSVAMMAGFSASADVITVTQSGNTFSPFAMSVEVGDVIHFVWTGGTHTTTSTSVPAGAATWDEPLTSANPTYDYTITVAGIYTYECTLHSPNMAGGWQATAPSSIENVTPVIADFSAGVDVNTNTLHVNITNYYPSAASLMLIDITGKEVAELMNRELGMGDQSFKFSLADRTSGIYFVRLEQNGKAVTRRILLN